jgi:hypothetical protein
MIEDHNGDDTSPERKRDKFNHLLYVNRATSSPTYAPPHRSLHHSEYLTPLVGRKVIAGVI